MTVGSMFMTPTGAAGIRAIVGASLDHLIGTWTDEEANAMDRALGDFSHVDYDHHFAHVDGLAWMQLNTER